MTKSAQQETKGNMAFYNHGAKNPEEKWCIRIKENIQQPEAQFGTLLQERNQREEFLEEKNDEES